MHRRKRSTRAFAHRQPGAGGAVTANDDLARAIVDWCGFPEICDRDACIRARRCRGAGVPCFDVEACHELMAETSVGQELFEAAIAADASVLLG
jgi:hypothetical protein